MTPSHQLGVFTATAALRGEVTVKVFQNKEIHRLASRDALIFAVNVLRHARDGIRSVRAKTNTKSLRKNQVRGLVHALFLEGFEPVKQFRARVRKFDPAFAAPK